MPELLRQKPLVEEVAAEIARALQRELKGSGVEIAITPETRLFEDLALDSLTLTSLVVSLEDHYRILLNETDAEEIRTVADLAGLVVRRVGEQT
jgi:acyl carrier protein